MSDFTVRVTSADTDPWEGSFQDLMATNEMASSVGDLIEGMAPGDSYEVSHVSITSKGSVLGTSFTVERL